MSAGKERLPGTRRRLTPAAWRSAASALGGLIPLERLHPSALAWARTSSRTSRWVVAFSGGADSLALLLLLWAHWPERRRRLYALHFDHRLRGRDSANDRRFCRTVCAALGVHFTSGCWSEPPASPSEAEARLARHRFLATQLRTWRSRALWFGHQQNDIAETMLMRLARGSGPSGLAAPRPVQRAAGGRVHLRPLLTLKKQEIIAALRALRLPWREDATNSGGSFLRNRLRRAVVPAWQAASGERDVLGGAALSRELIEEDDAALEAWVDALLPPAGARSLALGRLRNKPRAVVRRALHRWLGVRRRGQSLSRQAFAALLDDVIAGRSTRHSIGTDWFAVIHRQRLSVEPARRKETD